MHKIKVLGTPASTLAVANDEMHEQLQYYEDYGTTSLIAAANDVMPLWPMRSSSHASGEVKVRQLACSCRGQCN
jgi:hypothetical protein